jgi:hypothetical protein
MVNDRRKRRALSPILATEHFLEAEMERCSASALFLLDGGEVVASSLRDGEPLQRENARRLAMGIGDDGRDLYAHVLDVAGRSMLFASVGARVRSVREVERSIDRIFSM